MKQKIFILITLITCTLFFVGCKDENPEINPNFSINSDDAEYDSQTNTITFNGDRQTIMIDVVTDDASGKWDARCPTDDLWCTFNKKQNKLVITVSDNRTNAVRNSHITVVLGKNESKINIKQDYIRNLRFASDALKIGAAVGNYSIGIESNIKPENLTFEVLDENGAATTDEFWLQAGNFADGVLSFSADKNRSKTEDRAASIIAKGDGTKAEFFITQNMTWGKPYIVSLSNINWEFEDCYAYEIFEANEKIGHICREYLFKTDADTKDIIVQTVGVVAYPVIKGKVEHSNGLVIATIDNKTKEIKANGGRVMWNSSITPQSPGSSMISSFTNGNTTSMPSEIYFAPGSTGFMLEQLDTEDQGNAVSLDVSPWTVVDRRMGAEIPNLGTEEVYTYRVVKVGAQYWFADNLKTSRFRDGTPIPTGSWVAATNFSLAPSCGTSGYSLDGVVGSSVNANSTEESVVNSRNASGVGYNYLALFGADATVSDGKRPYPSFDGDKLSPAGWGVPKVDECKILHAYITQKSDNPTKDGMPEIVYPMKGLEEGASNITGFSGMGYRYRSTGTSVNTGNGTNYATIDSYKFIGTDGSGTVNSHKSTAFCCGSKVPSGDGVFRSVDVRWGIFVRCIQRN